MGGIVMLGEAHYEITDGAGRLWKWDEPVSPQGSIHGSPWFARYCYLRPEAKGKEGIVAKTVELGAGVQVDYDADGNAIGIEFL